MKKLLFNYCLEKFLRYEGELLGEDDLRTQMIALSLSNSQRFRRYACGCTTEKLCFCDPYYVHDLFLVVCADAIEHGDNLREHFHFAMKYNNFDNRRPQSSIEEPTVVEYTKGLYRQASEVDFALYGKLLGVELNSENILNHFKCIENIKDVADFKLELPQPCAATEMLDRAWERLLENPKFLDLFDIHGKHNIYGKSLAYEWYMVYADKLLKA